MYLITNRKLCERDKYIDIITESAKAGVKNIIVREKDLDDYCLGKLYEDIKKNINLYKIKEINLIINTNISVYESCDCDGIHLPFNKFLDLIKDGYKFKNDKILGISIHSIDEIIELEYIMKKENIIPDYIILSHIYETKCKENIKPKGIRLLKDARDITKLKIVALGGIIPSNVEEVMKYSDDFAVMSTVMMSDDVGETVKRYLKNK